jgi:hypothetical protein
MIFCSDITEAIIARSRFLNYLSISISIDWLVHLKVEIHKLAASCEGLGALKLIMFYEMLKIRTNNFL